MSNYNEYLDFAKDIAQEAGKIMLKYFKQKNISSYKDDNSIVTIADKEINSYLIEKVKEIYPEHCVDGEEEQFGESKYVWVCDPIDGTAMYARGIPVAVFSLALVIDGVPVVGVIYDPFTDGLYTAIEGCGAYLNGNKISVNNYELDNIRTVCHCDMWTHGEYDIVKVFENLRTRAKLKDIGTIARACTCVATGDFSLALFTGTVHKNCDVAAAKIIIEEAGGKVTDLYGNEQRYDTGINGAILSNGLIHDEVVDIVKELIIKKNDEFPRI